MDKKSRKRIVFIGDSITDVKFNKRTKHLKAKKAYPVQVIEQLNINDKIYYPFYKGIASNRSWHVYDRFTADCISLNPDIVVLFIGVNDAWTIYKKEDYVNFPNMFDRPFEAHFDELIRRLTMELKNARVILMTPFVIDTIAEKLPFKQYLKPYCEYIISKAKEVGYEYIELQPVIEEAQKQYAPVELSVDGIHPTTLGHSFIAKSVLEKIKNM